MSRGIKPFHYESYHSPLESFVLLATQDPQLTEEMGRGLEDERLLHRVAHTGKHALEAVTYQRPALVLLDTALPDADGFEVCRRIRARSKVPLIIVSDRTAELDRVIGFELGADDYVCKPFSVRELVCRIRAVGRRTWVPPDDEDLGPPVVFGDIRLDPHTKQVTRTGKPVVLQRREYELLWFLVRNPGRPFTRQKLIDYVWGATFTVDPRTVDVHICTLREKLERNPKEPQYLLTARRFGYLFEGSLVRNLLPLHSAS